MKKETRKKIIEIVTGKPYGRVDRCIRAAMVNLRRQQGPLPKPNDLYLLHQALDVRQLVEAILKTADGTGSA